MDLVTGYGDDSDSEGEHKGTCSIEECEVNSTMNSSRSNNHNLIHKQTMLDHNSAVTVADHQSIGTISAPTTTSSVVSTSSSTVTAAKKRKKFDISILPIEIQHALTRGDTLKDSDDDDDEENATDTKVIFTATLNTEGKKKHSSDGGSHQSSSSSSCPLLSLLPNPKTKNNVEVGKRDLKSTSSLSLSSQPVKGPVVVSDKTYLYGNDDNDDGYDNDHHYHEYKVKTSDITSDVSATTKQSKSTFSFGYVTTEETRIDKNGTGTSSVSNSLNSSGQQDDDDGDDNAKDWSTKRVKGSKSGVTPWFHADSKRSTAEVKQSAPMLTIAKPYSLTSNSSNNSCSSNNSSSSAFKAPYQSSHDATRTNHIISSSGNYTPQAVAVVNHEAAYEQFYQEQMNVVLEKSNKKKRDRDIELQLLAGDLSALDNRPNTGIKELDIEHTWDVQKYTDQQIREHEIQKGFGLGTTKSLMQVSKQQNRKHQLNSLAIKAAETELSLLEKRNHRMLTKSETQGKYGW